MKTAIANLAVSNPLYKHTTQLELLLEAVVVSYAGYDSVDCILLHKFILGVFFKPQIISDWP